VTQLCYNACKPAPGLKDVLVMTELITLAEKHSGWNGFRSHFFKERDKKTLYFKLRVYLLKKGQETPVLEEVELTKPYVYHSLPGEETDKSQVELFFD